jgi:hypothetical protein
VRIAVGYFSTEIAQLFHQVNRKRSSDRTLRRLR